MQRAVVEFLLAGLAATSSAMARPQPIVPGAPRSGTETISLAGPLANDTTAPAAPGNETSVERPVARVTSSYGNWSNPTCYSDPYSHDRRLRFVPANPPLDGVNMTIAACLDRCGTHGYKFGGVEYGSECYCDNTRPDKYYIGGSCEMPCSGDHKEVCGGAQSLLVYEHSA